MFTCILNRTATFLRSLNICIAIVGVATRNTISTAMCIAAVSVLLTSPVAAQRYTPAALCGITNNSNYESITLPISIGGDYPSGSALTVAITVGDTENPGGDQASTGEPENVIIFLDTDNDGTPETMSNASCAFDGAATPVGCTVTQNITIPSVTEDTTYRGRVMLSYDDLLPANGCGDNSFGDHEDFQIVADVQETITIADVSAPEDGGPITLEATLSHNVRNASGFVSFTVDYQTTDGTASIADNDYTTSTGSLTFSGQAGSSQTFTVSPMADGFPEGDQTVVVELLNLSNTTHGIDISDTATVTLVEDDAEVALNLVKTVSDNSPNVGDAVVFTLQVNNSGPSEAFDVVVQDIVPAGFSSIVPITVSSGSAFGVAGNTINWTGINVPVNGSAIATFSAVVLPP